MKLGMMVGLCFAAAGVAVAADEDADGKPLALIPYGCTHLRISAFGLR